MLKTDGFQSTAEIDARLAELEQEKKQLLVLKERLQQTSPNPCIHQNKTIRPLHA